jgi:radical SAM superfamily enzyme YgiQ (UPF0313 family)
LEKNNIQEFQNIGINCYTSFQYLQTKSIAEIIKEEFPQKKIIVGGYHPTAVPEDFTYDSSPFDFIIRGEAELPILNLFESNHLGKTIETQILNSNGCTNINLLPFPDYKLYLNRYPYKDKFKFEFFMSRGCPYQCAFCAKNFEFRSFKFEKFKREFSILCEIVDQYNSNLLKITFADQSFNRVSKSKKVLKYLIKNNLYERYNFSCQARVEPLLHRTRLIKMYRKAKMVVGFGFESASTKLLVEMHKTNNPNKYIKIMKKILKKYKDLNDIYCRLNILIGFPGETQVSFNETLDFVNKYALHENIQISPTLFSNYPNVFVYKNMDYYEKKFGTAFVKKWWKLRSNSFKNSIVKPSEFYTKKQLIGDYKDKYFEALRIWRREIFAELILWKRFYNTWYEEL